MSDELQIIILLGLWIITLGFYLRETPKEYELNTDFDWDRYVEMSLLSEQVGDFWLHSPLYVMVT